MPDGEDTVQTQEPVSNEEQVSTSAETPETPETAPEGAGDNESAQTQAALTVEKVQQMIAEATAKAVSDAKEVGRRELQSQQDRNKAELAKAERRARIAEGALQATDKTLKDLDPEIAKEIELARLRAEREGVTALESEEVKKAQGEAYVNQLKTSLESHLEALGIAKNDPRVDWANDAKDYLEGRGRFDASVAKIIKEDKDKDIDALSKRLKALEEEKTRESTEANSVETASAHGAVSSSDAEFAKKFGAGELPVTQANVDRYNKILESY